MEYARVLTDTDIMNYAQWHNMISPFVPRQVRQERTSEDGPEEKIISYGLSSAGYDIRCDRKFKVFSAETALKKRVGFIDPLNFPADLLVDHEVAPGEAFALPPNSYALTNSVERFEIPRVITATCLGKSTYARCGVIVNVTPLEPGWQGFLTIEISNASGIPVLIHPYQGICQLVFHHLGKAPGVAYDQRGGKYQHQEQEPVLARV